MIDNTVDKMSEGKSEKPNLEPLFFDLRITKAYEEEDFHEMGRILRKQRKILEENTQEERTFSSYEKAISRDLSRRTPKSKQNND